ncbi:tail protein X [Vibrio parahaemolyticus]|uniref:tail protein X n=1 Tax=Vibrio parahaemolyticus TaxID=670 RepID=UPI002F41840A
MRTLHAMKGEHWEQLCYRAYRRTSESLVMELRDANRELATSMTGPQFDGGEAIAIPVIDIPTAITETVEAPPWAS